MLLTSFFVSTVLFPSLEVIELLRDVYLVREVITK